MGLWANICSACSSARNFVKKSVTTIVDKVKAIGGSIKEKVTNFWHGFSGENKIEEAKALYDKISKRYGTAKTNFDKTAANRIASIERHVLAINNRKVNIKEQLFPLMADKLRRFAEYDINKTFPLETFVNSEIKLDGVKGKSQLFKIDFDNHRFKTTVQAIFTLGFYTRKKAQESLDAMKEEEGKIDHEIKKMGAELKRLEMIDEAMQNIETYFTDMAEVYARLINRVDCSLNYLYVRCISFMHMVVQDQMKIAYLPRVQQKEFEALDIASRILSAMVNKQILDLHDEKVVTTIATGMKTQYDRFERELAAA